MFARSYINTATDLLNDYHGTEPFHLFLKQHFSANKKYGSRDRKAITQLCYCYFRLGHSFKEVPDSERILIGLFLCSTSSNNILAELKPEWNEQISKSIEEKLIIINAFLPTDNTEIKNIFFWEEEVSEEIDKELFNQSFLIQPDLFLRLRPGYQEVVLNKLSAAGIQFQFINDSCIALPNATKVETVLELDKEAVVQDYNSQETVTLYKSEIKNLKSKIKTWDCCAGSGGKSILLYDLFPDIQLTVSDVRQSIIQNLQPRFKKAGIKNYQSFIADLTNPDFRVPTSEFNLIICDAPCTGSGTWGRTPEQLFYFEVKKIDHYTALQKNIVVNACRSMKKNGLFLYITCSIFRRENEDVVNFIQENTRMKLNKIEYLKGYTRKADTLFSALFTLS